MLFSKDSEDLRVVLNLKTLVLFCSSTDTIKPIFGVARLCAVFNRKAKELFGNSERNLLAAAVAERKMPVVPIRLPNMEERNRVPI